MRTVVGFFKGQRLLTTILALVLVLVVLPVIVIPHLNPTVQRTELHVVPAPSDARTGPPATGSPR